MPTTAPALGMTMPDEVANRNALGGPADIAVVERLGRTVDRRGIPPPTTRLKHVHDPADPPPVVNPRNAPRLVR